jgi:hypothetical protein
MTNRIVVSVCFIFLATVLKAQVSQSKLYNYPSDGFQITFPAEPTIKKSNVDTQQGPFELRSYACSLNLVAYYVGVCDYGKTIADQDPDTVLEGSKNGALANTKSHLIKEQKIKLSVVPGLAFDAESDATHFAARIYLAGTTLYQVLVAYPIGNAPADVASFLDFFGLITRSEP